MMVAGFLLAAAVGTLSRWTLSEWLPEPLGTLLVNLAGAFALGLLTATSGGESAFGDTVLGVAALGSLTTFSTLVLQLIELWTEHPRQALGYLAASLVGGVGLAWVGLALA